MNIVVLDAKTMGDDIDLSQFNQYGKVDIYDLTSKQQLLQRCKDADIIITNKVIFDREMLVSLPKLKLICLLATGMNNIDLQSAKALKIEVKNVAGYSTSSVAQTTLMLVLALNGRLGYYDDYVKSGEWSKSDTFTHLAEPFYELSGKKWGIIGMGTIGREVAKLATSFGCELCYYSTSGVRRDEGYEELSLTDLLSNCDIVTIHAPLNDKTKNLLGEAELGLMKTDAILVNVGRGGIVNEIALRDAIEGEKLYVGCDVLETEPMAKNSPLINLKCKNRYIIIPHIAWGSVEARRRLIDLVCKNIENFIKDRDGC